MTKNRRVGIVVAVVLGGIVVLNLLASGLDRAVGGNEPGGENDSSYATADRGTAAYASLLSHYDHRVRHVRGELTDRNIDSRDTIVVLQPNGLTRDETGALLQFVVNGGRLIIGGTSPYYLRNLRDQPPHWGFAEDSRWGDVDSSLAPIASIETDGRGAWLDPGSSRPLVGTNDHALITTEHVGQGDIFFVADPSLFENAYLAQADNAALALALAGPSHRTVVFAEGVHGYGESRGLRAIPTRWKWALLVLAIAALAFVWSRGRRFGPPDRANRELPPARAEYVRSLSITLERTRDRAGSFAAMQQWTRDQLARRASVMAEPNDDEIARAARALGCTEEEVAALFAPIMDDATVLALGRVAARVQRQHGSLV
ncbi:MAG TPA: DUF4350 domain-containing protein [Acidimicrobiia bacterium]|jgi:hypothetical protein|nr:DUF4350 domain-containing protein [Acidimicrobiia bacterium]